MSATDTRDVATAASVIGTGLTELVEAMVTNLPRTQRAALVLRTFHDLSYAEIATNLCCSEAEAQANVYAALRTLRDSLGDQL